jgi:hypothetical protein
MCFFVCDRRHDLSAPKRLIWVLLQARLAPQTAKPSAGLHTNGFALLPIEAGTIREASPFHVSVDAREEEDAQPDAVSISPLGVPSSGLGQFCAGCGFLNSIIRMRFILL